jgi:predicted permease
VRALAGSRGLTSVAVLSLALGIGANTAIFSLMDAVLLRFLPVREPQQLYFLAHGTGENPSTGSNYRLLEHYRNSTDVFSGIAAFAAAEFKVRNGDAIDLVMGQFASGNYYELLGVPMSLGRGFRYESEIAPDENYTAVISDAYWSRRFGRDPSVIGKTLTIEDQTVEIIGVTHPEFFGLYPGRSLDITIPLSMKTALRDAAFFTRFDNWTSMPLVGRLRPGVSEAEAQASIDLLLQQFLDTPESKWAKENSPEQFSAARLLPASRGLAELRQRFSKPLLVLMGMVGIVLLIACANIANLLLARAAARSKEIAVRLAMGAGRLRIMRQLFTESLVLALLGGGVGILVAIWTTNSLVAMMAVGRYPPQLNVAWDLRVFLFTFAVCLATATSSAWRRRFAPRASILHPLCGKARDPARRANDGTAASR